MRKDIVEKPITLLREDFIAELLDLCNNSKLPYFVIENVLVDVIREVQHASKKQIASDREKYNELINRPVTEKDGGSNDLYDKNSI